MSAGLAVSLWSTTPVQLDFIEVRTLPDQPRWPGTPILAIMDIRTAIIGSRNGEEVHGHWSSAPWFVAAAQTALDRLGAAA